MLSWINMPYDSEAPITDAYSTIGGGVELVVQKYGEEARGLAEQHIELDFGFIPENWTDIDDYYFPLNIEEDEQIQTELE